MRGKHILILALYGTALLPAQAQTVYRCGNSYSQTPCAGGSAINAADSRDKTQKTQADAAVRRDLKEANTLEKSRTRQEAAQARTARSYTGAGGYDIPLQDVTTDQTYDSTRRSRKPEYFTARTPSDHKKKTETAGHNKPHKPQPADTRQ